MVIKIPILVNETDYFENNYYVKNRGDYAAAIIVIGLGTIILSISSLKFCGYKNII